MCWTFQGELFKRERKYVERAAAGPKTEKVDPIQIQFTFHISSPPLVPLHIHSTEANLDKNGQLG